MQTRYVFTASCILPFMAHLGCPGHHHTCSQQNSCINALRQIEAGKEQWAMEMNLKPGDPIVKSEVNAYIKGGEPICPSGTRYSYNNIGTDATCEVEGHVLP